MRSLSVLALLGAVLVRPASGQARCIPLHMPAPVDTSVYGVVTNATTGLPFPHVIIHSTAHTTGVTDCDGRYALGALPAGANQVWFQRRGFDSQGHAVLGQAGQPYRLNVSLAPSAPPCCSLDGLWIVALSPNPSTANGSPVLGHVLFADSLTVDRLPDVLLPRQYAVAQGRYSIARSALFGITEASPQSVSLLDARSDQEALGSVFTNDSVDIDLDPRYIDAGMTLLGRIHGDSIVIGRWQQRAYAGGASGLFVMRRVP